LSERKPAFAFATASSTLSKSRVDLAQPRNNQHVAGLDHSQQLGQLVPVRLRPTRLFPVDLDAPGRLQLSSLADSPGATGNKAQA
jgi:hypothetical protein